ncbi:MAG: MFS transporter, partial [Chloroflexota bacterium]|nr:MFS transporter [Chloroflexota bacterium]
METKQSTKKGLYYGWVILGVGFFVFLNYGVFYSYGVYFKPLIAEFGWSRAETSFAFTLYQITYSFAAIPMGLLFDKYGPKVPLLLTAVLLGGGIALISQINSLWQLWLLFGIVAAFGHGATHLVPLATAVKWFLDRRGLAVGLVNSGSGVGLLLIPPLVGVLIVAL